MPRQSNSGPFANRWVFATLTLLVIATDGRSGAIYFNDFEAGSTAGLSTSSTPGVWANPIQTEQTPAGSRSFLGRFGNQSVTLSLSGLDVGTPLQVSFALFVIGTWDGNPNLPDPTAGPDQWKLSIVGGATLLDTTFSNFPLNSNPVPEHYWHQAYPGSFPGGDFPGQTGAVETDSLGYILPDFTSQPARSIDSVYRLSFLVTPTSSSMALKFEANLRDYGIGESINYESWGLDDVSVVSVPEPTSIVIAGVFCAAITTRRRWFLIRAI
jgi:hypothetical protein